MCSHQQASFLTSGRGGRGLSYRCLCVGAVGVCGDAGEGRAVCGSPCWCPLCVCVSEICSQPHYWANLQASEISEDYFVAD